MSTFPEIQNLSEKIKKQKKYNNTPEEPTINIQNLEKILLKKFYNSDNTNVNSNVNMNKCKNRKNKLFQLQSNSLFNQYSVYNKYSSDYSNEFLGHYPYIINLITNILYKYIYEIIINLFEEEEIRKTFLESLNLYLNYNNEEVRDKFIKKKIIVSINNLFKKNNITTFIINHFIYNIYNHIIKDPIVIINYFIHIFINTYITKIFFNNKNDICLEFKYNCNMFKNAKQWIFKQEFESNNSLEFILYYLVGYVSHFIHIRKRTYEERQNDIKKKNLPNDIDCETIKIYLNKLQKKKFNTDNSNYDYNFFNCQNVNKLEPDKNKIFLIRHKLKCIEIERQNSSVKENSKYQKKIKEYKKNLEELLKNSNILNGYTNTLSPKDLRAQASLSPKDLRAQASLSQSIAEPQGTKKYNTPTNNIIGGWSVPGKWTVYEHFTNFLVFKIEGGYKFIIEQICNNQSNFIDNIKYIFNLIISNPVLLLNLIQFKTLGNKIELYKNIKKTIINKIKELLKEKKYKVTNNKNKEYIKEKEDLLKIKEILINKIKEESNNTELYKLKNKLNDIYNDIEKSKLNIYNLKKDWNLYTFFENKENYISDFIDFIIDIYFNYLTVKKNNWNNTKYNDPIYNQTAHKFKAILDVTYINIETIYNELYDLLNIINLIIKFDDVNNERKFILNFLDIFMFPQNLKDINFSNSGGKKKSINKTNSKSSKILKKKSKKIIYKNKNNYLYNNFNTNS
jgi:hypothetical protein